MTMIWQQWEGTATTVANPSASRPGPLKAIFGSRPFWLKAILAQGHFATRPSDGGVGGGDVDGGADGDRDE